MSKGIPLTDEDRWDWLTDISRLLSKGVKTAESHVAVASCSALTRRYRDHLYKHMDAGVKLVIVFLYAEREELVRRVSGRANHYMGANMVNSQYDLMELPTEDEPLCIALPTDKLSASDMAAEALKIAESYM